MYILPAVYKCPACDTEYLLQESKLCPKCIEEFLAKHIPRLVETSLDPNQPKFSTATVD